MVPPCQSRPGIRHGQAARSEIAYFTGLERGATRSPPTRGLQQGLWVVCLSQSEKHNTTNSRWPKYHKIPPVLGRQLLGRSGLGGIQASKMKTALPRLSDYNSADCGSGARVGGG